MRVLSAVLSTLAIIGFAQAEDEDMDYYSMASNTQTGKSMGYNMSNMMMDTMVAEAVGDAEPVTTNTITFSSTFGFTDMSTEGVTTWGSRSSSTAMTGYWAAIGFENETMMEGETIFTCYVLQGSDDAASQNQGTCNWSTFTSSEGGITVEADMFELTYSTMVTSTMDKENVMLTTAPDTAVTANVVDVEWTFSFMVNDQTGMDAYERMMEYKGKKMPTILSYGHIMGGSTITFATHGE